jgi:hypothetical protein
MAGGITRISQTQANGTNRAGRPRLSFAQFTVLQNLVFSALIYSAFNEGGNTTTGSGAVNISRTLQLSLPIAE